MRLHLLQLPKLIIQRRSTAVFGVIIVAMVWIGIAAKFIEGATNDRHESERIISNFAMLFEENVLRSIGEIDKALLYLRRTVESKEWKNYQLAVLSNDVLSEIIVQVAIIDAKGIMRASNAIKNTVVKPIDLSDRVHFKVHVHSKSDKLYISVPVLGRASKKWSVQFTRRFLKRDGTFGGVVVASLNPAHFTAFYKRVDLGSSASISLIGDDGVVRASGGDPSGSFKLGADLSKTALGRRLRAGASGLFEDSETSGPDTRLVALRKVRGFPLWVSVSVKKSEIFDRSWSNLQLFTIAGILLTIFIFGAMERMLRSEESARLKAEQLRLTLEHMSQGIMLVTKNLEVPIINGRCSDLLGLPKEYIDHPPPFDKIVEHQAQARDIRDTTHESGPAFIKNIEASEEAGKGRASRNISICERTLPNGSVIEARSTNLPDGSIVQTFTDVTKRREAEARVARLASEDPLTGLPNRRIFRAALDRFCRIAFSEPGHPNAPRALSVLFLDLDRFKVVNDTLGHMVGDQLLQHIAERLKKANEPGQVLARLGGDEFAIVAPHLDDRQELAALAIRLSDVICEPCEIEGHLIRTSVSIGIAIGPHDGTNADDLLMASDLALYSVKANGRGTHRFFDRHMNEEVKERRQIETDLREAVEQKTFELHYQPIIDLQSNAIAGFEALIRWRHPEEGLVPPTVFIPVAEDTGLILPIGEWVLREACRTAMLWPDDIRVAVNLSAVQFIAPNLVALIEKTLAETGLSPDRLELEITESIFLDKTEATLAILHRLKKFGVRIAMDDFGTGYSSLSYLRRFPFDKIKIDRMFISDLESGADHLVIVQAIISIARALGMITTAEGVETDSQLMLVEALGCNEVQGHFLSEPVPSDRIPKLIAELNVKNALAA
jgi:diguanylate cyclase (GGDEF)-like protein